MSYFTPTHKLKTKYTKTKIQQSKITLKLLPHIYTTGDTAMTYEQIKKYAPIAESILSAINKGIFGGVYIAEGLTNIDDALPPIFAALSVPVALSIAASVLSSATRDTDLTIKGLQRRVIQDLGNVSAGLVLFFMIANSKELKEDVAYSKLLLTLFIYGGIASLWHSLLDDHRTLLSNIKTVCSIMFSVLASMAYVTTPHTSTYNGLCVAAGSFRMVGILAAPTVKTVTVIRDAIKNHTYVAQNDEPSTPTII